MTLRFYKQSATPNRINKAGYLTEVGEIQNVIIKQTDNELTPDFILQTNGIVYNSNYFFCDFTSRYYYITSFDVLSGGRIVIHARVDVLMTFRNEILSSSSWVECSDATTDTSDDYDMLHNDFPFRQDYKIGSKETFGTCFGFNVLSPQNIVLIMK